MSANSTDMMRDPEKDTIEDAAATFEELAQIELDFEDVDMLMMAQQYLISRPLYEKRAQVISKITNFWPLAFEMSPPEIDQSILPTDSEVIATALTDFSVDRFEIPLNANLSSKNVKDFGMPRSVSIRFEFSENEWFEDKVLEKKFYWRRANDGFVGLISEPVKIHWKPGKDLTAGLLDAACSLYAAVKKAGPNVKVDEMKEAIQLAEKVENTTEGGQSFFAWFGYIGRFITEQENKAACKEFDEKRASAKAGDGKISMNDIEMPDGGIMDCEIFPSGEELATELSDQFWPGALSFFTNANDDFSEADFEDEDEDDEMDEDDEDDEEDEEMPDIRSLVKDSMKKGGPPAKKQRN